MLHNRTRHSARGAHYAITGLHNVVMIMSSSHTWTAIRDHASRQKKGLAIESGEFIRTIPHLGDQFVDQLAWLRKLVHPPSRVIPAFGVALDMMV